MTAAPTLDKLHPVLGQGSMSWGVAIADTDTGESLFEHQSGLVLDTASAGKLILLAFAGNELLRDPDCGRHRLDRRAVPAVADSGIWQHLDIDELTVADAARLVFMASDNLATNVLLDHFGLERVCAFRPALGLDRTDLLDRVRDARTPGDPRTLSRGCAVELCGFMSRLARDELAGPELSRWLRAGLALNMDLGMVPAPLGLDPLARSGDNGGRFAVANKTGTDHGVRVDTGIIATPSRALAYAAICNYDPGETKNIEVMNVMHRIGRAIMDRS